MNQKKLKLSNLGHNQNNKIFGSNILFILNLIFILLILLSLSSVLVVADKLHSFQQKNEMIEVDGHKIVALDVTTNEECLMTIDGEAFIIKEKGKKGTDEVKIYVKQAIPIRTTDKVSIYCQTLIDVIVPRVAETKEIDVKDNTQDKTEEGTQANFDDDSTNDNLANGETVEVNNANGGVNDDVDGGINSGVDAEFNSEANGNIGDDKNTEGKSFFAKLWGFIKKLFS